MREQERLELKSGMQRVKEEATKETESLRNEMTTRFEKQLVTIENLIRDKQLLASKVEQMTNAHIDSDIQIDKIKTEFADKFKRELKKEKEAWTASEKVRKEKWEMDKIREIREGTVLKLEPTI